MVPPLEEMIRMLEEQDKANARYWQEKVAQDKERKRKARMSSAKKKTEENNLHANHRQRMKEKFLKFGFSAFNDHEILEYLLYYAIPQKDTNEIAHRLINKAGSLIGVFNLPYEELIKVQGVKKHTALFIMSIPYISRLYAVESAKSAMKQGLTYEEIGDFATKTFIGYNKEVLMGFYFDAKMHLLGHSIISEGSSYALNCDMKKITDETLKHNAANLVLAHNHPSNLIIPSADDFSSTKNLSRLLSKFDIILVEHFVVCGDRYVGIMKFGDKGKENSLGYDITL